MTEETVQLPLGLVDELRDALVAALRLSASIDAVDSAKAGHDTVQHSGLSAQLSGVLRKLAGDTVFENGASVSDQLFTLAQLTPEFVRQLMLDRGWQSGAIVPGSAQGETMARRLLHAGIPNLPNASLRISPHSAGHPGVPPDGWLLQEG